MVIKCFILKFQLFIFLKKVNSDNNGLTLIGECNKNNDDKNCCNNNNDGKNRYNNKDDNHNDDNNPKNDGYNKQYNYIKVLVNDPYNNRDIILKVTKKQKGVYI
jgi:hypothetical protein